MQFLLNTMTHWDEPPRARHQVAYALSQNFKVVFVAANKTALPGLETIRINDNLTIITPRFPVDMRIRYRVPLLNEIYQIWLFRILRKNYQGFNTINFDFTAYLIHKYFYDVTYYCNDNFVSISRKLNIWPIYRYHRFCEKKMITKSKLGIGTSRIITGNLLKLNERSYEIPLGGPDIEDSKVKPRSKRENPETLNIGLVGFMANFNLSFQLLNRLLSDINCILTLIGPMEKSFSNQLIHKDRIVYKGILTGKELLDEINKFDVAIAPYLDRLIDEGGLPNKLMFYLALGKPVVLSALESLKELNLPERMIYPVSDEKEFSKFILLAHQQNNSELIRLRVDYAKNNTWKKRIGTFLKLLSKNCSISHLFVFTSILCKLLSMQMILEYLRS